MQPRIFHIGKLFVAPKVIDGRKVIWKSMACVSTCCLLPYYVCGFFKWSWCIRYTFVPYGYDCPLTVFVSSLSFWKLQILSLYLDYLLYFGLFSLPVLIPVVFEEWHCYSTSFSLTRRRMKPLVIDCCTGHRDWKSLSWPVCVPYVKNFWLLFRVENAKSCCAFYVISDIFFVYINFLWFL